MLFQSRSGTETYTLITKVKPECSISDPCILDVGYRIKSMNGHDITQFVTTREIKNLMLQLDSGIVVEMVMVKPVGLETTKRHTRSSSDGLTLNLPSVSSGSAVAESSTWDHLRFTNGFHSDQCRCSDSRPPSTLHLGSVSANEATPQYPTGDSASNRETSMADSQQVDCTQGISRHKLELLAVKYPNKIRYEMPFKVVLNKNHKGRLGFSYKVKLNKVSLLH